uniref:RHD domain-containing protein n=1 Tax=Macrostomum lignano TaxID=282301 RepID=A0A1I8F6X3_9PLAT
ARPQVREGPNGNYLDPRGSQPEASRFAPHLFAGIKFQIKALRVRRPQRPPLPAVFRGPGAVAETPPKSDNSEAPLAQPPAAAPARVRCGQQLQLRARATVRNAKSSGRAWCRSQQMQPALPPSSAGFGFQDAAALISMSCTSEDAEAVRAVERVQAWEDADVMAVFVIEVRVTPASWAALQQGRLRSAAGREDGPLPAIQLRTPAHPTASRLPIKCSSNRRSSSGSAAARSRCSPAYQRDRNGRSLAFSSGTTALLVESREPLRLLRPLRSLPCPKRLLTCAVCNANSDFRAVQLRRGSTPAPACALSSGVPTRRLSHWQEVPQCETRSSASVDSGSGLLDHRGAASTGCPAQWTFTAELDSVRSSDVEFGEDPRTAETTGSHWAPSNSSFSVAVVPSRNNYRLAGAGLLGSDGNSATACPTLPAASSARVDADHDDSSSSCAEKLFRGLVGSKACYIGTHPNGVY